MAYLPILYFTDVRCLLLQLLPHIISCTIWQGSHSPTQSVFAVQFLPNNMPTCILSIGLSFFSKPLVCISTLLHISHSHTHMHTWRGCPTEVIIPHGEFSSRTLDGYQYITVSPPSKLVSNFLYRFFTQDLEPGWSNQIILHYGNNNNNSTLLLLLLLLLLQQII